MNVADYTDIKVQCISPAFNKLTSSFPSLTFSSKRFGYIYDAYNEQEQLFENNMKNPRLDRHKIAACLCIAVCVARPFDAPNEIKDDLSPRANEVLAVITALNILEKFICDDIKKEKKLYSANSPLIQFPELIKDEKANINGLISCLYFSHKLGSLPHPWWLSQIFYYIDNHSRNLIQLKDIV